MMLDRPMTMRQLTCALTAACMATALAAPVSAQQRQSTRRGDLTERGGSGISCVAPIDAGAFPAANPFIDVNTTCGKIDNYNSTCLGNNFDFDGGEDVIYEFTITEASCITIILEPDLADDPESLYSGMALFDTCDPNNAACLATSEDDFATKFIDIELTPGAYYLMIDNWPPPGCVDYTLTIQTCLTGACCFDDGSCQQIPLLDCFEAGGQYSADEVLCEEIVCGQTGVGDDCSAPVQLTLPGDAPYISINSTCGRGDDFTDTCLVLYDDGEDIIYELNVTQAMCLTAILGADDPFAGMALFDGCSPEEANCIAQANIGLNPEAFTTVLDPGTYYLMVDTYPDPTCVDFFLILDACAVSPCCMPDQSCTMETLVDCQDMGGSIQTLALSCGEVTCPKPVTNETCDSARLVTSLPFVETIDTILAQPSEPIGSCNANGITETQNDVWYTITPASDCFLLVDVNSALDIPYDAIVTIWTGESCDDLGELACGDEPEPISIGTFAQAGNTYWIQVGDYGHTQTGGLTEIKIDCVATPGACCLESGACVPTVPQACAASGGIYQGHDVTCEEAACPQPLVNDTCHIATEIIELSLSSTNVGALGIRSTGCAAFGGHDVNDVWFSFTPTCDTTVDIDLCDSQFDTVLSVFSSCDDELTEPLACNDDRQSAGDCDAATSRIDDLDVLNGQTIYIRVAGWTNGSTRGASEGVIELAVEATPVCASCDGDTTGDGTVNVADLLAVINNWGSNGPDGDVNNDGSVNVADLLAVINNWGNSC